MNMIHIKMFEGFLDLSTSDRDKFMDYFMGFYGPNEIYGYMFDYKLDRNVAEMYIDDYIKIRGENFEGDSFDREIFRDVLRIKLGFCNIKETEYGLSLLEPFLTDLELNVAKYNL